jgi:hypothetical protein
MILGDLVHSRGDSKRSDIQRRPFWCVYECTVERANTYSFMRISLPGTPGIIQSTINLFGEGIRVHGLPVRQKGQKELPSALENASSLPRGVWPHSFMMAHKAFTALEAAHSFPYWSLRGAIVDVRSHSGSPALSTAFSSRAGLASPPWGSLRRREILALFEPTTSVAIGGSADPSGKRECHILRIYRSRRTDTIPRAENRQRVPAEEHSADGHAL